MTCEQAELLLIERDDTGLSAAMDVSLADHLAGCAACRTRAAQLKSLMAHLTPRHGAGPGWLYWRRTPRRIMRQVEGAKRRPVFWPAPIMASLSAVALLVITLNVLVLSGNRARELEKRLWTTAAALSHESLVRLVEETPETHSPESYIERAVIELATTPLVWEEEDSRASIEFHLHYFVIDDGSFGQEEMMDR